MKLEGFTQRSSNLTSRGNEELPPRGLSTTLSVPAVYAQHSCMCAYAYTQSLAHAQLVHEQLVYGLVSYVFWSLNPVVFPMCWNRKSGENKERQSILGSNNGVNLAVLVSYIVIHFLGTSGNTRTFPWKRLNEVTFISFIHSVIIQVFIEYPGYAWHCSRPWDSRRNESVQAAALIDLSGKRWRISWA